MLFCGGGHGWASGSFDLSTHRAIVVVPYDAYVMSYGEYYAMGIPLLFPVATPPPLLIACASSLLCIDMPQCVMLLQQ